MAKGWESKSVESQVEDSKTITRGRNKTPLTPAQVEVHRRREVLLLSRASVKKDRQASQNQRYRDQHTRAVEEIDA